MNIAISKPSTVTWYPWYVAGLLSLAYLISFVDRITISLLIVPLQEDLLLTDTEVSLLVGLSFALFYTLFGLPIGRLVDKWNRRNIVIAGIVLWSLANIACGFALSFMHLFVARLFVGVGEATITPSAHSMLSDYFKDGRLATAMSIYNIGLFAGAGVALIVAGSIIAAANDAGPITLPFIGEIKVWQLVFIVTGIPGFFVALAMLTVVEPERHGKMVSAQQNAKADNSVPISEVIGFLKLNRAFFFSMIAGYALLSLYGYGLTSWAPTFFMRTYGWDQATIGWIYGGVILTTAVTGALSGGLFTDWLEARGYKDAKVRTVLLGCACMAPCAIVAPLMPGPISALIMMGLTNFFFSFPSGSAAAAMQSITPNQMRGQIAALFLFVVNIIGLGLGPTLVAVLTDFVFEDKQALRYSLFLTALVLFPFILLTLNRARRAYSSSLENAKAWAG